MAKWSDVDDVLLEGNDAVVSEESFIKTFPESNGVQDDNLSD